jgi:hypothetical protein
MDLSRVFIHEKVDNVIPYEFRGRDIRVPDAEVENFISAYLASPFFAIFEYFADLRTFSPQLKHFF